MAMPSRTRCGSLSRTLRSMNAPGSPSSALQMTYFWAPCGLGDGVPLEAGRVAGAAAAAQAAAGDLVADLGRGHLGERRGAAPRSRRARRSRRGSRGRSRPEFSVAIRTCFVEERALRLGASVGVDGPRGPRRSRSTSSGRTCSKSWPVSGICDERAGGAQPQAADALDGDVGQAGRRRPARRGATVTSWTCADRQLAASQTYADARGGRLVDLAPVVTRRRTRPRRGGHLAHSASSCCDRARPRPPCPPPRRRRSTAGARLQAPRQRAVRSETLPSAVVSLGLTPSCRGRGRRGSPWRR